MHTCVEYTYLGRQCYSKSGPDYVLERYKIGAPHQIYELEHLFLQADDMIMKATDEEEEKCRQVMYMVGAVVAEK